MTREAMFESVMREYGQKTLQLVYLFVKDHSLAEDITQDVFLKAYKSLHAFRGDSDPKTWIYRIAVNEAKKYLRSWSFRNIFSTLATAYEERIGSKASGDVEQEVFDKIGKAEMVERVMSISPAYREVITLHYFEELSIKEIAYVLGVSDEVVRARLSRARKQLRKLMEQEGSTWM